MSEKKTIEKYGFEVRVTYTGEKALSLMEQDPDIDLILMDIDLGSGMSGTEAAKQILEIRELPVVFLTSHAEKEMVDTVKDITRYGYVLKKSGEFVLIESINMAFELFESHQNLKDKERRLELAIKGGNLGTWEYHVPTGAVSFNRIWAEMKGYSPKEFTPHIDSWKKMLHPDDLPGVMEKVNKHLEGKTSVYEAEYRIKHKSGDWIWVSDQGMIVERDSQRNPVLLCGINTDITKRRQTENRLRQSMLRSQWLSQIAHHILSGWSIKETIDYTVEQISNHFPGLRVAYSTIDENGVLEVLSSKSPGNMVDIEGLRADLNKAPDYLRALRGDKPVVMNNVTKDERMQPLQEEMQAGNTRALVDAPLVHSEQLVGLLCFDSPEPREWSEHEISVLQEIADYLALVLKNQHAQQKLRESRWRYRKIFTGAPIGIATIDQDGYILTANPFFCQWLGYSLEELKQKTVNDLTHPEDLEQEKELIQELQQNRRDVLRVEKRYLKKDGSSVWGELVSNILYHESESRFIALGMVVDVTERKQAEARIQNLLEEKDMLVREVHHRIKNDMNTINSLLYLQASSSHNPGEVKALEEAQNRISLMRIIYEKLYLGHDFSNINIMAFLLDLIERIEQTYTVSAEIEIETDIDDVVIPAKQSFPVGIIVNELITNAFKYAFPDSGSGKISVSVHTEENSTIEINVADNGAGIPDEVIKNGNYGFGLTLVDAFTEQYGGSFSVENKEGSSVTAWLHESSF
jgi:PAS domain S-box-containing protein